MTKTKNITKISICALAAVLPLAMLGLMPVKNVVSASVRDTCIESVSISNSSFNSISTTYSDGDVTGWKRKRGSTGAKTMIIDVVDKWDTYSKNTYRLRENPEKMGDDNKVLMINSASSSPNDESFLPSSVNEGYISNAISLAANSYYEFQVSMKSASFDDAKQFGSIYISGLVDEDGDKVQNFAVEKVTPETWQTYYFYISTGAREQSVTIDLWLGTNEIPSTGVVFFDEVRGNQLSENAYFSNIANRQEEDKHFEQISLGGRNIINTDDINFNFEKDNSGAINTLVDWEEDGEKTEGAHARIFELDEGNFTNITSLAYPGHDMSANNTKALAMWADKEGYISLKSQPIEIKSMARYKITARVKTTELSGGFSISARETNQIKEEFKYLSFYQPKSASSNVINSNGSNKFINEYMEVSICVQGHDRYDSEIELLLNLGSKDSKAKGGVVVDNITVEVIDSTSFDENSALILQTAELPDGAIANGNFNKAEPQDNKLSYPVSPANWKIEKSELGHKQEAGIINIYSKYFDNYDFYWKKGLTNPGSPNKNGSTADVNNILMMFNETTDYQSITSDPFKLEAGSYNKLSFRFKTLGEHTNINVKLEDEDGVIILNHKAISSGEWADYECEINAGEASTSVKLTIELGNSQNKVKGYAFFDYVSLSSSSKEAFDAAKTKVDLSGFMLSLDPNGEISNNISSSSAFKGEIEVGSIGAANGGIIKGKDNDAFSFVNEDGEVKSIDDGTLTTNVLVIETNTPSTYKLSSIFKLTTEADKYYSLSFRLLTSFPGFSGEHKHGDDIIDGRFGVSVGLSGFDSVQNLTSNDGWKEYTILFKASSANDANFTMSLVSDCLATTGYAYMTDIKWQDSDEETYNAASGKSSYGKTLFTTKTANTTDEDNNPDNDSTTPAETDNMLWILIPSLIMGAAVIIAVIGFGLRHVKFKKIEKVRKEEYDREHTLNNDVLINEAKNIQKVEIEAVDEDIAKLEAELEALENENKLTVAKSREEGRVTKEIEREFKSFANKSSKLQKKLGELKEHKAFIETADYLLAIEKRIVANKKQQEAEEAKKAKAANKKTK